MSLTKDWEYKLWPLVEKIMLLVYAYDIRNDDGETESDIHDILCAFVDSIEECSNFNADSQLHAIVREITTIKTEKDLLVWQGKSNGN